MNKGILEKLKNNYILQLKSGLQFGIDEKRNKQHYQSETERVQKIIQVDSINKESCPNP